MKFEGWRTVKLKDIAKVEMGQSPKSEFYNDSKGTPFLQGTRTFQRVYPLIDTYTLKVTKIAEKGDILFSVRAPVGEINFAPTELCIGRGLAGVSSKSNNQKFLYYLLIGNFSLYESQSTGTIFSSINKKSLEELEFTIPNEKEQKKIGEFMWRLDEKIELNNSIISNLEELAQTLFKHWFVDFEFPNESGKPYKSSGGKMVESELGMIPKEWLIKKLGDVLDLRKDSIKPSETTRLMHYVPIDMLPMKKTTFYESKAGKEAKSSLIQFQENDILLGAMRVYFHRVCIAPYDGITRTTSFVLRPIKSDFLYYCLLTLFQAETINYAEATSKGSTIPYATWENGLDKYQILIPKIEVLKKYNTMVEPLFKKMKKLSKQNEYLNDLRDTLLPKLLSGEIEQADTGEVTDHVPVS